MKDEVFVAFKKVLPRIKKGVLLKKYTTFKIGGPARYFLVTEKKEEIIRAFALAKKLQLPTFVLGGGSNILASDCGFDGLVVKIHNAKPKFQIKNTKGNITIKANAGAALEDLVKYSTKSSLQGLEWAGGLPGTLGGAIRGNAGAFGGEIKDSILKVEALDNHFNVRILTKKQCLFSYRSSIFKKKNWVVLSAILEFKKGNKENLQKIAQSNMNYRKERHPLELPNAGSIFKNCDFEEFSPTLKKSLLAVVKKDPFLVVPVAYLIAQAGLKGMKIGSAQVSEKHPNFIVNLGGARADDILKIIDFNKKSIKEKYGVNLEQEVQFLEN